MFTTALFFVQMVSSAVAAPGYLLPSAHPVAKGAGQAEASFEIIPMPIPGSGSVSAEYALTDRVLVSGYFSATKIPFEEADVAFPASLALEGGSDRVRLDLSMGGSIAKNFVAPADAEPVPNTLLGEGGITWRMSKADSLRFGVVAADTMAMIPLPSIKYQHSWKKALVGLHVGFTPLPTAGVSGGVRW